MSPTIDWKEVAIRLGCALLAGTLIGFNRGEQGRAAGFRTTILVTLAACVAMIQANLLMDTDGRKPDSFIMLDLMRLPLGILSGIGFIGAGAILRRGALVTGVTTAATLWFVTVMGLCFGGGQIGLGFASLGLGIFTLWILKAVDFHMVRDRRVMLLVTTAPGGPSDEEIRQQLSRGPLHVSACAMSIAPETQVRRLHYQLDWHARQSDNKTPEAVQQVAQLAGVVRLVWKP